MGEEGKGAEEGGVISNDARATGTDSELGPSQGPDFFNPPGAS